MPGTGSKRTNYKKTRTNLRADFGVGRFLLRVPQRAMRAGNCRSGGATGDREHRRGRAVRAQQDPFVATNFWARKQKVGGFDWLFGKPFVILAPHSMTGNSIPRIASSADLNNYMAVVLYR